MMKEVRTGPALLRKERSRDEAEVRMRARCHEVGRVVVVVMGGEGGSKVNLKQQKQGSVTFPLATLK